MIGFLREPYKSLDGGGSVSHHLPPPSIAAGYFMAVSPLLFFLLFSFLLFGEVSVRWEVRSGG